MSETIRTSRLRIRSIRWKTEAIMLWNEVFCAHELAALGAKTAVLRCGKLVVTW